jgi:hypothetical protein
VIDGPVQAIAEAVLYEGHVLFPYRLSALKNRQRWTFGGVYPPAYAERTSDRSRVAFDVLVEGAEPQCEVEARYLRIVEREGREVAVERTAGVGPIEDPPGLVETSLVRVRPGLHRLSVAIENRSTWAGADRNEAMRHTLASAHAVARVAGGAFLSALDAHEALQAEGLWPFLVGEPGDRSTVLGSPIILYDWPRVAPESPGDFFDGCEIDQLLVLSILGLSDGEKEEIRTGDPHARAILERTEAMTRDDVMRLHGAWRSP